MNKGRILTTDPLKSEGDIKRVKTTLKNDARALALFTTGINTALRSSDLLGLKRSDLKGDELFIRERKTKKLRKIVLNKETLAALRAYLRTREDANELMFLGLRGRITHGWLGSQVKKWFKTAGVQAGRYATHSLRKTFVRINYERGVPLATLMVICNHSSERQVLTYCGITAEDVQKVYDRAL